MRKDGMEYLDQKLGTYAKSGIYPFHMPGHKRAELEFPNPYRIDITEIDGFDNLHDAKGILAEAQERAARLFGAKKTFYLVNGSTCGLLAAISAAAEKGSCVLMARNSHKAAYHAAYLRELKVRYLYPRRTEAGIQGAIAPEDVERAFSGGERPAAVIITSPTYDGVVSDVEKIAGIAHAHGVPLIVDGAHGAHFGFHKGFPASAVGLGADAVVQSLHKTLPSFTQTALLHLQPDRIPEEKVQKFLGIYETSSPSYLLMAGMEKCVRLLEEEGETLFSSYDALLTQFLEKTELFKKIKILKKSDFKKSEAFDFDRSKILISVRDTDLTGRRLYDLLLEKYGLQMEMASGFYVTAITGIMDRREGFDRLYGALREIDEGLGKRGNPVSDFIAEVCAENEKRLEIAEALDAPSAPAELKEAAGKTAAEFISLYPPGIPILVPGEVITEKIVENVKNCEKLGLNVQGLTDGGRIKVVDDKAAGYGSLHDR